MEKKRILVADDDQSTREALLDLLTDEDYDVAVAANGQEAVAQLASFQPDLVLTDFNMPGLDGMDVLAHVKHVYPATPVIIFTADTAIDARRKAQALGVQDYLNKPLDLTDTLERIAHALTPEPGVTLARVAG